MMRDIKTAVDKLLELGGDKVRFIILMDLIPEAKIHLHLILI